MKKYLLILVFLNLAILLSGCTTVYNPATGKKEAILINTEQEVEIGKSVAREVLKQYKILDDVEMQRYVQRIGQEVAAASDRQDLQYSFLVLDNEELNAFAVPGGGVFVNKGLVNKLDKDELACVLSHEVGHIAARHAVKRIQGQMGFQWLLNIALYEVSIVDEELASSLSRGTSTIFGLILLGYSRQDELLADRLAMKYARKAGYNPWGMVTSLKKLEDDSQENDSFRALAVLRSHPYISDRIQAAKIELNTLSP